MEKEQAHEMVSGGMGLGRPRPVRRGDAGALSPVYEKRDKEGGGAKTNGSFSGSAETRRRRWHREDLETAAAARRPRDGAGSAKT
jgi:hypothetical protein